jgi:hypothetical protein
MLGRIVDAIVALGGFAAPDWSQRSLVKVIGSARGSHAFFTAVTGQEWYVTLKFRVPRNAFRAEAVAQQLGLRPFHEASPPVLCDNARVSLMNFPGGIQEVVVTACRDDLDTPAFSSFLARAAAAYAKIGKSRGLVKASELL